MFNEEIPSNDKNARGFSRMNAFRESFNVKSLAADMKKDIEEVEGK